MLSKSVLSKKHEKLIDIEVEIPNSEEINSLGFNKDWIIIDHRGNAENSLIEIIKIISKNTKYEGVCNNIVKKCEDIFKKYE